ncbi:hypothetical protein ACFVX9_23080 [Kitasatospora sp. NPDC058243]|uniref:hypothetical protein n=1 Tax=Kitasatospora sp. NPDC058243 TaxID=3346397 RepID=UPI0036D7AEA0
MSERAAPFFCPYCGDEDLRPSEVGHGAWECHGCRRAFQLKFLGLLSPTAPAPTAPAPTAPAAADSASADSTATNSTATDGGSSGDQRDD